MKLELYSKNDSQVFLANSVVLPRLNYNSEPLEQKEQVIERVMTCDSTLWNVFVWLDLSLLLS